MTGRRAKVTRLAVAVLLVLPSFLLTLPSSTAATTQGDVDAAKAKLDQLNHELEVLVEQYNASQLKLQEIQGRLADAERSKNQAASEMQAAQAQLTDRAVEAYTGMGSQFDVLLGAESFGEFSDRLQYMGAIAQSDADLASEAAAASQRYEWAEQQYADAAADQQAVLKEQSQKAAAIKQNIADAETYYEQTKQDYEEWVAHQEALQAAAEQQAAEDSAGDTGGGGGGTTTGGGGGGGDSYGNPPPVSGGAGVAINAAYSVLGTQYVWGAADPDVGFDCSGLTMWAWAQAGVYLPHSSAAQYSATARVSLSAIQPGDLLFFYSPISHVSLYIGGGRMIHARHPGPGGQVQVTSLSSYDRALSAGRV